MMTFFMAVETEDGSHSNGVVAAEVMLEAVALHVEAGKAIHLRITLEKDGEIYYNEDGKPTEVRIPLI